MYLKKKYDKAGPAVAEEMRKRGFDAYYCSTADEAREKALELIPEEALVSWGGSMTIEEIGLKAAIKKRNPHIDRDTAANGAERMEFMRKSLLCDVFLMSSNAISQSGELVNIDGLGNRVAALCFGPKEVIVIAGMNKVVADLESAYKRARTYVAPVNAQRFDISTPCAVKGMCYDCKSENCICSQIVVTRFTSNKRIKVILVGETLGF